MLPKTASGSAPSGSSAAAISSSERAARSSRAAAKDRSRPRRTPAARARHRRSAPVDRTSPAAPRAMCPPQQEPLRPAGRRGRGRRSARCVSRIARNPSHAPLPSSPTGNPHPPTATRRPSRRNASPTLPVPAATIAPGRPSCAPSKVVYASVSSAISPNGGARRKNSSQRCRTLAPASPRPSAHCSRGAGASPASANAPSTACTMCCHACSIP